MRASTLTGGGFLLILLCAETVAQTSSSCLLPQWNVTTDEPGEVQVRWTAPASDSDVQEVCACYPIAANETDRNVTCSDAAHLYPNASCRTLNSSSEAQIFSLTTDVASVCLFSNCGENACDFVNGTAEILRPISVSNLHLVAANKTHLSVSWMIEAETKDPAVYFHLLWCITDEPCSEDVGRVPNCSGERREETAQIKNYTFQNLTPATTVVVEVFAAVGTEQNASALGDSSTGCFRTQDPELKPVTILPSQIQGITGILLSWEEVRNTDLPLSGYTVQWCVRNSSKCPKDLLRLDHECNASHLGSNETNLSVPHVPPERVLLAGVTAVYKFRNGTKVNSTETTECIESLIKRPKSVTNLTSASLQNELQVSWDYLADNTVNVTPKYDIRWCPGDTSDCADMKLDFKECNHVSVMNGTDSNYLIIRNLNPWSTVVVEVSAVYQDESRTDLVKGPTAIDCFRTQAAAPGSVNTFAASSIDSRSATIEWSSPRDLNGPLDGYKLVLCKQEEDWMYSENGSCSSPLLFDKNNKTYLLENLIPWTSYVINITAFNDDVDGNKMESPAETTNFTTAVDYPGSVKNFKTSSVTSRKATVEWSPPSDLNGPLDGYKLLLCKQESNRLSSMNGSCNTPLPVDRDEKMYVFGELTPWTSYTVNMTAYNVDVNRTEMEGPAEVLNFRTAVDSPSVVVNLKLTPESDAITVTWKRPTEPNGPISNYKIILCKGNTNVNCSMAQVEGEETSHTFQDIEPWENYSVKVLAVNVAKNESLEGPPAIEDVKTLPSAPTEPQELAEDKNASSSALFIRWNPPKKARGPLSGYNVSWAPPGSEGNMTAETNETEFEIAHLKPYTTYTVSVRAFNEWNGLKWYGTPATHDLRTDVAAPEAPGIDIRFGARSAAVALQAPSVPNGPLNGSYLVNCMMHGGCSYGISSSSACSEYEAEDRLALFDDLLPWTDYEVRAKMYNVDSKGVHLNGTDAKRCFRTKPAEPSEPSLLRRANYKSTSVTIAWSPPVHQNGPIDGYRVRWTDANDSRTTDVGKNLSYTISGLQPYSDNTVEVFAFNLLDSKELLGPSTKLSIRTEPEHPGPVLNLRVDAFPNNTALLTWLPPEVRRGLLEGFVVKYNASKPSKPTKIDVIVDDPNRGNNTRCAGEPVTCTLWVQNLPAEYEYIFDVRGKNQDVDVAGEAATTPAKVIMPPGDPPKPINPSVRAKNLVAPDPQSQHTFVISRDTFDDFNGDIIEYTVVLGSPDRIAANMMTGEKWKAVSEEELIPPHPVTPDHWNPFNKGGKGLESDPMNCKESNEDPDTLICVLGTQSCTGANLPCNGPLKPGTKYAMYVIGHTRGGQVATAPEEFKTIYIEPVRGNAGAVVGGIISALLIMALVLGGAIYLLRSKNRKKHASQERASADRFQLDNSLIHLVHLSTANGSGNKGAEVNVENGQHEDNRRYPVVQDINKPIPICDFEDHLCAMLKDSAYRFADEYERLVELSPQYPSDAARDPANSKKNRFTNIHPFDKSRVPLSVVGNDENSSYINASFVQGCNGAREYIAAQGPNLTTINDFWRMIWEHDIQTVIMLTQCVEGNKKKCEKYWPDDGKEQIYGTVQVRNETSERREDYILTEFSVKSDDSSKWRSVQHLFFTAWSDHGTPETPDTLIKFVRTCQVMFGTRRGVEPPVLVHCSAGVGRTGTFIALDCCLQKLDTQQDIDIFHLVLGLRECRRSMVQNEKQYVYLYQCVNAVIQERKKDSSKGEPIYQNLEDLKMV